MAEPIPLPVVRVERLRRTDEELARDRECTVQVFSIEKFTCDDCPARWSCGFAFDPYNVDGDCLAEK